MIYLLVGHRGVGKSNYLSWLKQQDVFSEFQFLDLDHEIESRYGAISSLFSSKGEAAFREIEEKVLNALIEQASGPLFIALGAGYMKPIPEGVSRVFWLRRPTDQKGRLFLNRPRLNESISPLDEFTERLDERNQRYSRQADQEIELEEGQQGLEPYDFWSFGAGDLDLSGFDITWQPSWMGAHWRARLQSLLKTGLRRIELRDDLLDESQLKDLLSELPKDRRVLSLRRWPSSFVNLVDLESELTDWANELGDCQITSPGVISIHDISDAESDQFLQAAASAKAVGAKIKWAPIIRDYGHLQRCHDVFVKSDLVTTFLPRSDQGRWAWYRLVTSDQQQLNFVREGMGSAADQPSLREASRFSSVCGKSFAAILGQPVQHSMTPPTHQDYFALKQRAVLRVDISDLELTKEAFEFLLGLGLTHAAVTSPLKIKMSELVDKQSEAARRYGSVNTIRRDSGQVVGHNTDIDGLAALFADLDPSSPVIVWGGGGVKPLLLELLPKATFVSARQGLSDVPKGPQQVVWAVGRHRMDQLPWPSDRLQVASVFDLNYAEDSPGIELAMKFSASYRSGSIMFFAQAEKQQEFWSADQDLLETRYGLK